MFWLIDVVVLAKRGVGVVGLCRWSIGMLECWNVGVVE